MYEGEIIMNEKLRKEVRGLKKIPGLTAIKFYRNKDLMLSKINQLIEERGNLNDLLNINKIKMMHDNHRNHIDFMSALFILNRFELLMNVIPWVYISYHSHSFKFEYFKFILLSWKKVISEVMGDEAIEIIEVYDWILEHHQDFINLAQNVTFEKAVVDEEYIEEKDKFLSAMLKSDYRNCMDIAKKYINDFDSLMEFYSNVIRPAMYEVGSMWMFGKITVAEEHLMTAIITRILSSIYLECDLPGKTKGTAFITSSPNEYHEVGAWIVAHTLEYLGWRVIYLGANMPQADLIEIIRNKKPDILGISVAMQYNLIYAKDIIDEIKSDSSINKNLKVIVGGQAFNTIPDLYKTLNADSYANEINQLIEITNKWWEEAS